MNTLPLRGLAVAVAAVGLSACTSYDDYRGSRGYASYRAYYPSSYYGGYDNRYYPGIGSYLYDRDGRRYRWNDSQRRYWQGWRGERRENWDGYGRDRGWDRNRVWNGPRNGRRR